jgi:hypothetical protein
LNLFDSFFDYVKDTEPPLIYYRWSLVSAIGAFMGRRAWIDMGRFRVFPNHFVMLIGNPGTRKNTAVNEVTKLLIEAGYTTFSATKTRKEQFLYDLQGEENDEHKDKEAVFENIFGQTEITDVNGREPREVFIVAPEFNNFLPKGDLEFLSDLGDLWDWDKPKLLYTYKLRNAKSARIYQPTISILGGNTHTGFQEMFPAQSLGQGIISRKILVYSEPTGKKFTFLDKGDDQKLAIMVKILKEIREKVTGTIVIREDARRALDVIYRSWRDIDDQRFKHYSTRRFTHLLKLCIVCGASRVSRILEMSDILLANSLLTFTESAMPKALGEFGKSRNAEAANKVMNSLYDARKPLSLPDLWKVVSNDLEKMQQLSDLLVNLQNSDKIQVVKGQGFLPKQRPLDRKLLYVDYNLLKEFKEN